MIVFVVSAARTTVGVRSFFVVIYSPFALRPSRLTGGSFLFVRVVPRAE
jgi:hypothetical protein